MVTSRLVYLCVFTGIQLLLTNITNLQQKANF